MTVVIPYNLNLNFHFDLLAAHTHTQTLSHLSPKVGQFMHVIPVKCAYIARLADGYLKQSFQEFLRQCPYYSENFDHSARKRMQYFRRKMTNAEPVRKASRRGRVFTTIPRLLQLLQSLSTTARLNLFTVTELSTGADLVKQRLRAQNQLLRRKRVNAIIEEYKRKWTESKK